MSVVTVGIILVCMLLAVVLTLAAASIRILREHQRAVVFRLGRLLGVKGPGLILLIPAIDRMVRVDLRTVTLDVPPQNLITRDNVPARGERGLLLPRDRRSPRGRRGPALSPGHLADRTDHVALGARQGGPRHAAVRARAAQRGAPAHHRRAHRPVGDQGHDGRDQGRRDTRRDATRDGARRPGGARATGERDPRRGRVPGLAAAAQRRRRDLRQPGLAAAPLSANADRDRRSAEFHRHLPAAARRHEAVRRRRRGDCGRRANGTARHRPPHRASGRRADSGASRLKRVAGARRSGVGWFRVAA
jgi:hypothetical protein